MNSSVQIYTYMYLILYPGRPCSSLLIIASFSRALPGLDPGCCHVSEILVSTA